MNNEDYFAFEDCYSLTRVDITDIAAWCNISYGGGDTHPCFNGAKLYLNGEELTHVTIPSDVTYIKDKAFYGCSSIRSVTISDNTTSIGHFTFKNCGNLASVDCKPTTPPTAGVDIFEGNASDRKIYVPASDDDSVINAYKTATNWSDYADYIECKLF